MDTPFRWHAGTDRLTSPWSVPVPLLPDELLSSWLIRAALAQGCDPAVLTHLTWPGWRVWTRDVDRGLTPHQQVALAMFTGLPIEAAEHACLRSVLRSVAKVLPERATWLWTLVLGSRNTTRKGGLQYCPACWGAERRPYFRLSARLAWHTCCPAHGCLLIERCAACQIPLEPHRHLAVAGGALHLCSGCGFDLRTAVVTPVQPAALTFQQQADQVIRLGHGPYGGASLSSEDWFALARYFVSLLGRVAGGRAVPLGNVMAALGVHIEALTASTTGLALESLPAHERAVLLAGVVPLLRAGGEALLHAAQTAGLSAAALADKRSPIPACIIPLLNQLPACRRQVQRRSKKATPRSPQAVRRKMARLRRKVRL